MIGRDRDEPAVIAAGEGSPRRKVLVVERELTRDSGHHHTQIAALEKILPQDEILILSGFGYDGFLPHRHLKLSDETEVSSRIAWRLASSNLRKRVSARLELALAGRPLARPTVGYRRDLEAAVRQFGLSAMDRVVVPSATLEDLVSVSSLLETGAESLPRFALRFLTRDISEQNATVAGKVRGHLERLAAAGTILFTETEELAAFFSSHFHLPFRGGFYLPCSLDPDVPRVQPPIGRILRVGVLGLPKGRKGSGRVRGIVRELRRLGTAAVIVVQGRDKDFGGGGVYADLEGRGGANVRIERAAATLSPEAFSALFLSLDVVLLPYELASYGLQGSGIVQDAVAAEIAIVHTRGLSMARFLTHGNAVAATSDDEFAEAITAVAEQRTASVAGCHAARLFFRDLMRNHPLEGALR